jgi:phage shock protein E
MITFIKNLLKPNAEFNKLIMEGAVIIDVRTKDEFEEGHIEGSKNIPPDTFKTGI